MKWDARGLTWFRNIREWSELGAYVVLRMTRQG